MRCGRTDKYINFIPNTQELASSHLFSHAASLAAPAQVAFRSSILCSAANSNARLSLPEGRTTNYGHRYHRTCWQGTTLFQQERNVSNFTICPPFLFTAPTISSNSLCVGVDCSIMPSLHTTLNLTCPLLNPQTLPNWPCTRLKPHLYRTLPLSQRHPLQTRFDLIQAHRWPVSQYCRQHHSSPRPAHSHASQAVRFHRPTTRPP